VFSRNETGANPRGLLNATADSTESIVLPDEYKNGTKAILGDNTSLGFPTVRKSPSNKAFETQNSDGLLEAITAQKFQPK
jgi:hypothetical protein